MRLGHNWWFRIGQKKTLGLAIKEITGNAEFFLGLAVLVFAGASYLRGVVTSPLQNSVTQILMIITVVLCIISIGYFACSAVVLVRSLYATSRFQKVFGFPPPVTYEGGKAIQMAVDQLLIYHAINLQNECSREKELEESIRANSMEIDKFGVYGSIAFNIDYVQKIGANIAQLERELDKLEDPKGAADKKYREAHDAAGNPFLPIPLKVRETFQGYLPATTKLED